MEKMRERERERVGIAHALIAVCEFDLSIVDIPYLEYMKMVTCNAVL